MCGLQCVASPAFGEGLEGGSSTPEYSATANQVQRHHKQNKPSPVKPTIGGGGVVAHKNIFKKQPTGAKDFKLKTDFKSRVNQEWLRDLRLPKVNRREGHRLGDVAVALRVPSLHPRALNLCGQRELLCWLQAVLKAVLRIRA